MTIVDAIRTRLLALSAVTNLVGQRVYAQVLPQSPTLPAIRIQRIDEPEIDQHMRGAGGLRRARVQIDAVTDNSRADAVALDEAIAGSGDGARLRGWHGTVSTIEVRSVQSIDVRESIDPIDLHQYKIMRDYEVFWRPA